MIKVFRFDEISPLELLLFDEVLVDGDRKEVIAYARNGTVAEQK